MCTYTHMHACIYASIHSPVHAQTHILTRHIHKHMYAHTYTTCIHMHKQLHTHAHTLANGFVSITPSSSVHDRSAPTLGPAYTLSCARELHSSGAAQCRARARRCPCCPRRPRCKTKSTNYFIQRRTRHIFTDSHIDVGCSERCSFIRDSEFHIACTLNRRSSAV